MALGVQLKFINESLDLLGESLKEEVKSRYLETATSGSAGIDLRYCGGETLVLRPNECVTVKSGISIYIKKPEYVGLIFPRSGLGSKGIVLGNLTGVIDSDYQGELMMSIWNRSDNIMEIEPSERVCQYLVVPRLQLDFDVVEDFDETTDRGGNGYGSSGRL